MKKSNILPVVIFSVVIIIFGAGYIAYKNVYTQPQTSEKNSLDIFERPEYTFMYPVRFKIEYGPSNVWEFRADNENITLQEVTIGKYDDRTILSLVTQFTSPPTNISETIINKLKVITADYRTANTGKGFKLGDESMGDSPTYGVLVTLPKTKLFFFISGTSADRDMVLNTMIESLKVINK